MTNIEYKCLEFPEQFVGRLFCGLLKLEYTWSSWGGNYWVQDLGFARGQVVVPANMLIFLRMATNSAADLIPLAKLAPDALHAIHLPGAYLTYKELEPISHFTDLVYIAANNEHNAPARQTSLDQSAVQFIGKLKQLWHLELPGANLTDVSLSYLQDLKQIRYLDIGRNDISDAGMPYLVGNSELQILRMVSTRLTDKGFEYFTRFKSLKEFDVLHTKVSQSAIDAYKKMHPQAINTQYFG